MPKIKEGELWESEDGEDIIFMLHFQLFVKGKRQMLYCFIIVTISKNVHPSHYKRVRRDWKNGDSSL